ncbi:unnamed protein product [Durusdinium trenchii]|uniref:Uncharacterized protein n=1 Tax=Durusdinium trenchii TaxID=1381693 RepID=A0ABP0NPJ6_9DINO
MAVAFKMELSRPAPLQLPSEPPSPAGSLVFTPGNAPSTYWRTTICPGAPYKRDQRAGSTPRSGPPTPAVSWPSPTSLAFEPSFQLTPTNTLSSAFPETFFRPTRPTLRRACTLPPAHETVDSDDDEELLDFQIDRTVSEPHVPQAVWKEDGRRRRTRFHMSTRMWTCRGLRLPRRVRTCCTVTRRGRRRTSSKGFVVCVGCRRTANVSSRSSWWRTSGG